MLVFGFLSFLAFGLVLVLVGANQAHLERDLGLTLAQSGLLVSALSLGLGLGVVGAGPLFDRYPRRPLVIGSMFELVEVISYYLQDPFENETSDTPMTALSTTIEINLRQQLGETELPEPKLPIDGVLM